MIEQPPFSGKMRLLDGASSLREAMEAVFLVPRYYSTVVAGASRFTAILLFGTTLDFQTPITTNSVLS
jgi:hypothetical protein